MTTPKRIWVKETINMIGKTVLLKGWVHTRRDHGKLIFIDLRDRSGILQLVCNPENISMEEFALVKSLRAEDVIEMQGEVIERAADMVNPKIVTGKVEVKVTSIAVLSRCTELPFEINSEEFNVDENVRLRYRYLDLRRPQMQEKMMIRSQMIKLIREYFYEHEFIEIETPMLTKSTPEGARDFIVPSRLQPGKFYALPQSPQQYKQLLMVAGLDRYFQIARCIRDEDLRADRGFEFTQLDIEMSFVEREDVMQTIEEMMIGVIEALPGKKILKKPFPRLTYKEAFAHYGADKFDMRTDPKDPDELAFAWVIDWPTFERTDDGGWTYSHNPFTGPKAELLQTLKEIDLDKVRSKDNAEIKKIENLISTQYDLVCNGYEVGGGGIRIHDAEALAKVFQVIGHPANKIQAQFGHILEAFGYGVPPHGGIALGLDRLAMLLAKDRSLKEVIAFPMTNSGRTAVMDAPSEVEENQLIELGIQARGAENRNIYDEIVALLKGRSVSFKEFEHEPVLTSEQAAQVRGTDLASGAKALLVKADDGFHLIVISAAQKFDSKSFRKAMGSKKMRFATEEEVTAKTGCQIGAVPPFGNLFGLKVWVDESILTQKTVDFNAGERTKSIEMKTEDFLNIVPHTVVKPIE